LTKIFAVPSLPTRFTQTPNDCGVKRTHRNNNEFNFDPRPRQQRIAGILSAYDELIENSQRRIKILESMARALYREWFVHFRFPGHENHPRVASPLGEIPLGWEVKSWANHFRKFGGGKDGQKTTHHGSFATDIPEARLHRGVLPGCSAKSFGRAIGRRRHRV
jgi:hypothetical protein